MKAAFGFGSWVLVLCSAAAASNVDVTVIGGGSQNVTAVAGGRLEFQVTAELSDDLNEGLAFIVFDLSFSGGPLNPLDAPTTLPMSNFARPDGITNPAGYGGTLIGNVLEQVGGCQNTIKNNVANAPFPIGSVITGIAWPGSPVTVAGGSIDVPAVPGAYTITVTNMAATVIEDGQDGSGAVWVVQPAGAGTMGNLSINVVASPADPPTLEAPGGRYLAVTPGGGTETISFRVTPTCAGGGLQYVGAPSGPDNVAFLVDDPLDAAFLLPGQWGTTVYVTGANVIPSTDYGMVADTGVMGSANLMPAISTTTPGWGEVNGVAPVDIDDVICILSAFASDFGCSLYATDLLPTVPTQLVDLDDILAVLGGFSSDPYPGPTPCN